MRRTPDAGGGARRGQGRKPACRRRRLRLARRNLHLLAVRSKPVMVHRYPAAIKAFYMAPDPEDHVEGVCAWMCSHPRATARSSAARSAWTTTTCSKRRIEEHGLPLDAFQWYLDLRRLRLCAALRLRHGHRARGCVDLRARPRAGNDPIRTHAEQDLPVRKITTDGTDKGRKEHG